MERNKMKKKCNRKLKREIKTNLITLFNLFGSYPITQNYHHQFYINKCKIDFYITSISRTVIIFKNNKTNSHYTIFDWHFNNEIPLKTNIILNDEYAKILNDEILKEIVKHV